MGFCNCSMFCCALLCVHSSFTNILDGEERAGCFAMFVFLVSHDCCVSLPRKAMGLSAVCDRGISWSYCFWYRSTNDHLCYRPLINPFFGEYSC